MEENNLVKRHRWQFLTSDPRFKSTWLYCVKEMTNTCVNKHQKREYPSAMIRKLVNGFVHDLRPPQLHMFLSEADRILTSSPAVFVASSAPETEKDISPEERERVRKLNSSSPRFLWSCFKDEFEAVGSAS